MAGIFWAFIILSIVVVVWKSIIAYAPLHTEDVEDTSFTLTKDVYLRQQRRAEAEEELRERERGDENNL